MQIWTDSLIFFWMCFMRTAITSRLTPQEFLTIRVRNLSVTRTAFSKIAPVELSYRGMDTTNLSPIYDDIRNTSLNITTRGLVNKEKFDLLQKGIKNIKPFMYKSQYRIEEAIADATKLNKLKMNNPEAFFYWWKTEELLSSK